MPKVLVVKEPFADFVKGEVISDTKQVAQYIETHPHSVILTEVPDAKTPAPTEK